MTRAIYVLILVFAGCAPAGPPPVATGEITHAGQSYAIERLETHPEQWRVRTDDGIVACTEPTLDSCYWSLRAHLVAVEALDDPN